MDSVCGQKSALSRPQRGFSLLELVFALSILTIVLGTVMSGLAHLQKK